MLCNMKKGKVVGHIVSLNIHIKINQHTVCFKILHIYKHFFINNIRRFIDIFTIFISY